jgi:hypothetical protein
MRPTRRRDLATAALLAVVISYLVTRHFYSDLPSPGVYSLAWLVVLTIAEVYVALVTRSRLAGRHGTRPINPLVAARIAALAKATSLVGALALGGYAGFFGWVIQLQSTAATRDARTTGIGVGLSMLLIAAAMFLEHVCRVPDNPDDDAPPDDPDLR